MPTRTFQKEIVHNSRRCDKKRFGDALEDYVEFITAQRIDHLLVMQLGLCTYCSTELQGGPGINYKTNPRGVTVERVNNDIPHVVDNCLLACMSCNNTRRASYTHDEFKEHFADIKLKLIKKCQGDCGEIKSTVEHFHKDGQGRGYKSKCRDCYNALERRRRAVRREARLAAVNPY